MECKCESCARKDCTDRTKQDDSRIVTCCSDYMEHKKTNADRIRAMSDEELAEFITDKEKGWLTEVGRQMYYDQNLEWLKQPAEMPKEE